MEEKKEWRKERRGEEVGGRVPVFLQVTQLTEEFLTTLVGRGQ